MYMTHLSNVIIYAHMLEYMYTLRYKYVWTYINICLVHVICANIYIYMYYMNM
jgi:hypothetical protein